ncbi:MAG: VWA domain-containing protein [Verrucomicrobiales bacterium]|jgi:hypothetical protein|nr:VWA domain-containing protein [Verrucomicrobiales bacterium]
MDNDWLLAGLALLMVAGLVWALDRLGKWLRQRQRPGWRQGLLASAAWLAARWRGLGRRRLQHPLFTNARRVYGFSIVMHVAALLLVGWLVRGTPAPRPGAFQSYQPVAPELVGEEEGWPGDDAPPADGDSAIAADHDIRHSSGNQTAAALLPKSAVADVASAHGPAWLAGWGGAMFGAGTGVTGSGPGGGGQGRGTGGGGSGQLGGMEVPLAVAVVLDVSGSMDPYLRALREQIRRQFAGAPVFESPDSRGELTNPSKKNAAGKAAKPPPWLTGSGPHLYDQILQAAKSRTGLEAVYVLSDFQDGEMPAHTAEVVAELRRRRVKLYLCYTTSVKPFPALARYASETGDCQPFAAAPR